MIQFLFTLVKNGHFKEIDHQFPFRGHSFLPCDRHFATIERQKRKKDTVEWYPEWISMVRKTFNVVEVQQHHIHDFKEHLQQYFKKSARQGNDQFTLSKYKRFHFNQAHPFEVQVSISMMGFDTQRFCLLKPNAEPTFPSSQCYSEQIPIKEKKLQDVKKLMKYLSQNTNDLISQLTSTSATRDNPDNSDYE